MRALKKLSRSIASALFTVALGETFDWVQSVPVGERPRYSPQPSVARASVATAVNGWNQREEIKPSAG
jgi:hypothetical protein